MSLLGPMNPWTGSRLEECEGLTPPRSSPGLQVPATVKLYSSKWRVFEFWCLAHEVDPVNCPVGPVLEFFKEKLPAGAAITTLRVYVTAIAARSELDEIPLGRPRMVSAFMCGVRRLRPVCPIGVPCRDLSVVLEGLMAAPF